MVDPLTGETCETLKSPASGLLFTLREYPVVHEGSLIARIQRPYNQPIDRIRIGKKVYRCDLCRRKKVFIVSEVP